MDQDKNSLVLGQLLVRAGLLAPTLLDQALENAKTKGIRLGQVLLYSGLIVEPDLKAALQAQRLIRQSMLTLTHAVESLKVATTYRIDLNTAIARLRWLSGHRQIYQFARILLDANVLSLQQLDGLLAISSRTGAPLGRLVTMHHDVDNNLRSSILDSLILMRSGELSYEQGTAATKIAFATGASLTTLLGMVSSPVASLSREFHKCGILTLVEVSDIIEESLQRETLWQGVYVMENLSAHLRFAASLKVVQMMESEEISAAQARSLCDHLLMKCPFKLDFGPDQSALKKIA